MRYKQKTTREAAAPQNGQWLWEALWVSVHQPLTELPGGQEGAEASGLS